MRGQPVEIPPLAGQAMDADDHGAAGITALDIGHVVKTVREEVADAGRAEFHVTILAWKALLHLGEQS
jgi:hypothetical protein